MTNERHAALYAAMKLIEAELEGTSMDHSQRVDLSGQSVTITFSEGTSVNRPSGQNKDGTTNAKCTQSLYGYAVWCLFLKRLQKFNQHQLIRNVLMDVWKEVATSNVSATETLLEIDPELNQYIENLKNTPGPTKPQQTTRRLTKGKDLPLIQGSQNKQAA